VELEMKELFGLPAHPLLVHAVVVLLPLAVLATIVSAAVPGWRRHYAPVALGLAIVATGFVALAQGAGEELEDEVDETELVEEHAEEGETVLPWALGVTVAALAVSVLPVVRRRRPAMSQGALTAGVVALALVTGAGAVYTVIDVGHSGAKATWEDVDEDE
jgi:uncharacterized membrane protein